MGSPAVRSCSTEWTKGEFITVVRNDNYWKTDAETGQQLPYLDSVTFRFIPETESIINAFRARELDVIQPPPNTETIETLQALEPEGARRRGSLGSGLGARELPVRSRPLRAERELVQREPEMRLAVAQTIDKRDAPHRRDPRRSGGAARTPTSMHSLRPSRTRRGRSTTRTTRPPPRTTSSRPSRQPARSARSSSPRRRTTTLV